MAGEIQLNSVTLATESGGVASIDSSVDIKGPLNASGSAPLYACRAWVNFDGTGTVAIRASGNVSSITDNGTGDYTINFTNAMPDANYCCVDGQPTGMGSPSGLSNQIGFRNYATTSINVTIENSGNGIYSDKNLLNVAIFR